VNFLFINVNHDVEQESSESIPISLGYILAYLKAFGHEGVILDDIRSRQLTLKGLDHWIKSINPRIVGFTAYQSTMERIRFLAHYIKLIYPDILIALGGPQIALMPSAALNELLDVDLLVRGDGESALQETALILEAGGSLDNVPGISYRSSGRVFDSPLDAITQDDLDIYPSPYLTNLLNLEGKTTAIMLSSRGCRHVCRFCITPRMCGGKVRYHSIDRVMAELEHLGRFGIERFWFADPTFTQDRDRTELLLKEKIRRGITTPFWCQTRADLVDAPLLKLLKDAGADTIAFGLESGSPGVIERTGKGIELDQLRKNVRVVQSLGLETELFSIFGLPGETVEDAKRTIDFLSELGIPILSNSGSQQMQLYFGSVYELNPKAFGIKPIPGYSPSYMSVGEDYGTSEMDVSAIRKIRNLWALANEQMENDVYYKQRVFEIIDFLLENRDDLENEPAFYAYGALTCAAIEEFDLLKSFLEGFERLGSTLGFSSKELIGGLSFFQETDDPAGETDRIIFDSRSYLDGLPFTGISGKFWDVVLGRGLLLPSFEEGFLGIHAGETATFKFTFPNDYTQIELRDKDVEVQAKIHKVFKSFKVDTIEDVRRFDIRNNYEFQDLDLLREQNEILYYLALRDTNPQDLLKTPSHFLMLVHKLAKLGKRDEIIRLSKLLEDKPSALNAFADTLAASGKCSWALDYFDALPGFIATKVLKKARCLLRLERYDQGLALLESVPEAPDLEFQQTLLELLKKVRPNSVRIQRLNNKVNHMRVEQYIGRASSIRQQGGFNPEPLVHGRPEYHD
jgi:anaerobic magnesium-protoporphyrin IX monomethyl ester cyclase